MALPPCARLLEGGHGAGLRTLAARLLARLDLLSDRWTLACEEAQGPDGDSDHASAGRAVLSAAASGDAAGLVRALSAEGRRLQASGIPLQSAMACSHRFVEACLDVLSEDGAAEPELLYARGLLDRVNQARVALYACIWSGASGEREEGVRAGAGTPATLLLRTGEPGKSPEGLCHLVGASEPMQRLYDRILLAARGRETVLITGESGTGKELVARAIHQIAGDPPDRFIAVNCAALPRDLMESELFGYRRGAFSGAVDRHPGLVRAAEGGTLFLDEISELAPEAQAKLLRVIQERAVRAVGDTHEARVDVRIVAATNQPPGLLLQGGRLRRDLYYRLQRTVIDTPPLREHLEDLPLLCAHIARKWPRASGEPARRLTPAALRWLGLHDWPGNVRELENAIWTACSAAAGAVVELDDLPPLATGDAPAVPPQESRAAPVSLREAEREAITRAMSQARGNKSMASRLLGISRKQLYVKLRVYGLEA